MEFRILGPLEVAEGGRLVRLQAAKLRSLLGILLVRAGETVSTDELVEALWPERPPTTARKLVQIYVSNLRRAGLGDRIVTRSPGYALMLADQDALDRKRFEELTVTRPDAGPAETAERLREGLALWRGSALADLRFEPWAQNEAARLEELRLAVLERRIEADLALGRHQDVVAELDSLVSGEPLRERLRGHLMLALYRAGRQAEALEVYRAGRRFLVDELGIEPSEDLQRLEQAILRQDETLQATSAAPRRIVHLPRPPKALIGRERDLREIDALLAGDVRLLTLCGAGGSGKTRLALEAAWNALRRFPDGAVFVPLASITDPALVLQTIARSLGLREGGSATLEETLGAFLHARRLLVVLDNLEHLLEAGPPLAELLAEASDVRMLATSRAALRLSIERAYTVAPLALPGKDDLELRGLEQRPDSTCWRRSASTRTIGSPSGARSSQSAAGSVSTTSVSPRKPGAGSSARRSSNGTASSRQSSTTCGPHLLMPASLRIPSSRSASRARSAGSGGFTATSRRGVGGLKTHSAGAPTPLRRFVRKLLRPSPGWRGARETWNVRGSSPKRRSSSIVRSRTTSARWRA